MTWVSGDVGEVTLQLANPLPLELKVPNLSLVYSGLDLEVFPSSLSLAPQPQPYTVSLLGVPRGEGSLSFMGYRHTVLGRHQCLFSVVN